MIYKKRNTQTVKWIFFGIVLIYLLIYSISLLKKNNRTFIRPSNQSLTTNPFYVPLINSNITFIVHHNLFLFYESAVQILKNEIKHNIDSFGDSFDYVVKLMKERYGIHGFIFYFYFHKGKFVIRIPNSRFLNYPFCLCLIDYVPRKEKRYLQIYKTKSFPRKLGMEKISYYLKHENYMKISLKPIILLEKRYGKNGFTSQNNELYFLSNSTFKVSFMQALDLQEIVSILSKFQTFRSRWSFIASLTRYEQFQLGLFNFTSKKLKEKVLKKLNSNRLVFTPMVYQNILLQKLLQINKHGNEIEKAVFINSWSDMLPNTVSGYAYLEATRMALLQYDLLTTNKAITTPKIAIFIHAFFLDILIEIIQYLVLIEEQNIYKPDLYIATLHEHVKPITSMFSVLKWTVHIYAFENRGRDILPFLTILGKVHDKYNIIIKLNTKKSMHSEALGRIWRNEAYKSLIEPYNFLRLIDQLIINDSLGIIYPAGMALPMKNFTCNGYDLFSQLCLRMGLDPIFSLETLYFGAGTMFIAKARALKILLHVASSSAIFEVGIGRLDGTLAHAYERAIAVSVYKSGYTFAESGIANEILSTVFGKCIINKV